MLVLRGMHLPKEAFCGGKHRIQIVLPKRKASSFAKIELYFLSSMLLQTNSQIQFEACKSWAEHLCTVSEKDTHQILREQ